MDNMFSQMLRPLRNEDGLRRQCGYKAGVHGPRAGKEIITVEGRNEAFKKAVSYLQTLTDEFPRGIFDYGAVEESCRLSYWRKPFEAGYCDGTKLRDEDCVVCTHHEPYLTNVMIQRLNDDELAKGPNLPYEEMFPDEMHQASPEVLSPLYIDETSRKVKNETPEERTKRMKGELKDILFSDVSFQLLFIPILCSRKMMIIMIINHSILSHSNEGLARRKTKSQLSRNGNLLGFGLSSVLS